MYGLSLSGRAAHFFQLCLKSLIRRLLKLLDASIFTRREVVEIIKIAEITYGDSVLHILARDSAYGFEVLQFLQDWLFAGKLPDEKNKENKTALAVACETDPQGAMEMFVLPILIPSDNHQQPQQNQPAESPTQNTQFEETLLSNDGGVSTNVVDVDIRVPQTSHFSNPEEFPDIDTGNLFPHFTVPVIGNQSDLPYITEVFSLCSKESLTSGKISDSSSMLEGLIMPSSVEIVESPAGVSSASANPSLNNVSASVETCINVDNSFGLGALGLKSSNVLGMAFTQYSDKLSELVESLPKLDHLIEEAAAVIDKIISRVNLLEKKLDVVKRDALAKMKSIQELRSKKELLCNETRRLKRNLDYCQEKQYQLVNHCKKGRLP